VSRVCDVIFHARLGVELEFSGIDRPSKPLIDVFGIIGVSFRVVDVFHMCVASQPLARDVKLVGRKPKFHETQNADNGSQHGLGDSFETCGIDDLRKVSQPVPKVYLSPFESGKAIMGEEARRQIPQCLCNIAMSPDVTVEGASSRHFSSAKG
jgi:hypothetical protein